MSENREGRALAKMGWEKDKSVVIKANKKSALTLDFPEDGKSQQWKKSINFEPLHHYNQSNKYVLAVSELANEIRQKL